MFAAPIQRLIVLMCFAVASLILAGCGGPPSKADYEQQVDTIARAANRDIGKALDSAGPPGASELKRAGQVMQRAADDLAEIEPPADVQEAHRRMIKGMRGLSSWFENLAVEVEDLPSDRERADLLLGSAESVEAREAFDDVRWAQRTFKRLGYRVFDAAEEASQTAGAAPATPAAP